MFSVATISVVTLAFAQVPFALDTTFRTTLQSDPSRFIASVWPQPDGKIIASGRMRFPGESYDHSLVRFNANGSRDVSFNNSGLGTGIITPWQDRFYVGTTATVRRILMNGTQDPTFIEMNSDPLFLSNVGGGYHVFPDGRIVICGSHQLRDSVGGPWSSYQFIWFTNAGQLDTSRIHRRANGSLRRFAQMPDGKFVIGGFATVFEGSPVSRVFRVHADGALDDTFQSNIYWGGIQTIVPTMEGKVYVGGTFLVQGYNDTLRLARFLSDGTLDPGFTPPTFGRGQLPNPQGVGILVAGVDQWPEGRLVVTGQFQYAGIHVRRGICMLDSNGTLLQAFDDQGVWPYTSPQGPVQAELRAIVSYGNDQFIVWGAYRGYGDGEIDDMGQGYMSRLHRGGDGSFEPVPVGVEEPGRRTGNFHLYPNPTRDQVMIDYQLESLHAQTFVFLRDLAGRELGMRSMPGETGRLILDVGHLAPGLYVLDVRCDGRVVHVEKFLVQ